jgi:hypothetical protein
MSLVRQRKNAIFDAQQEEEKRARKTGKEGEKRTYLLSSQNGYFLRPQNQQNRFKNFNYKK